MNKVLSMEAIKEIKQETAQEIFEWLETHNRAKEDNSLGVSYRGLSVTFCGSDYWYQKQKYNVK